MTFLNTLSIRSKLVFAMLMAVIISTTIVGYVGHSKAKELLISRLQQSDLPNLLYGVRNSIGGEISEMKALAKTIATNPFLLDWIESGATPEAEPNVIKMLRKIASDNHLSGASFADRTTAKYWNQDGFLRVLQNDQYDSWFFSFKNSGNAELASMYTEQNGDTNIYINYQQLNGRGIAGLSKSFNAMVDYLNSFKIEQTGFVFLVDDAGLVKIHKETDKNEKANITDLYQDIDVKTLLSKQGFSFQETTDLIIATSYIPALDWYVVAQVPKAELYAGLNESRNYIFMWLTIIIIAFSLVSIILAKSLTKPIHNLTNVFKELGEGDGNLSYRLDESGGDEIAQLAKGFNAFINKIYSTVNDVSSTSKEVHQTSIEVSEYAQQSQQDAHQQLDIATQVATAISEMGSTIAEIASNAVNSSDSTNEASDQAKNAQQVVQLSTENIHQMSLKMDYISTIIESLAEKSDAISAVLDVISSISDQTNLLALNAAIEAARAGDHGRGFSVVADEVRGLAKRTSDSTDEINQMISQLQLESKQAVKGVQESKETAEVSVLDAQKTTEALNQVVNNIQSISDLNAQVATATEEQAAVVNEIDIHIHTICDCTESSTQNSTKMATSSEALTNMSTRLDSLVKQFKF